MSRLHLPTCFALLVIMATPSVSFGLLSPQLILSGTVTDATTGSPLIQATVLLTPEEQSLEPVSVATDEQGRFYFTDTPAGAFTLKVSYIGFSDTLIKSDAINFDSSLTVRLTPVTVSLSGITVTASRRPEKVQEAPTAVTVLEGHDIHSRTTFSVADHLTTIPAVDVAATGLNSSNVVARGFNNIFSTTLLTLVDYRIARVPSLRVNVYQFIPTLNEDIERIEIASGPGSALYGPNSANGVLHIITKSPFSSSGGVVSLATGERSLRKASLRYSQNIKGKFGYKISANYYQAHDWESFDPAEPSVVTLFRQTPDGDIPDKTPINNRRDFRIEKSSLDLRFDYAVSDDAMLVVNGGLTQASNIELTDIGAAQGIDWRYGYGQARITHKSLFAQVFVNGSDAGKTYLRRSGAKIIDKSRLYVGQLQHGYSPGEKLRFTYGYDALLTRPNTGGTINGRNELDDAINEHGVYALAEYVFSRRWKLLAAGRADDHNLLESPVFSPRAAIIFHPRKKHTLRATFNQAYGAPSTAHFFLDVLAGSFATEDANPALIPVLGSTIFDARALGARDGFSFNYDLDGRPQMVSLYGPAIGVGNSYLPADVNSVWPALRDLAISGDTSLAPILPTTLSAPVPGQFMILNTVTLGFDPFDPGDLSDIRPVEQTRTQTFELGYKGVPFNRLALSVNAYYSEIKDFIGPLNVESPHVFIDSSVFVRQLTADISANTGGAVDSSTANAIATGIFNDLGELPIGLVSPTEIQNPTDVVITFRNFGDIDLFGADIALNYHVSANWDVGGTYSYLEKNLFHNVDGVADIPVNAPKHKFSLAVSYSNPAKGIYAKAKYRFVDQFPARSGVFSGNVKRYGLLDLNIERRKTKFGTIALTIQNATNNKHSEFIGAPELGRMTIVSISQQIF